MKRLVVLKLLPLLALCSLIACSAHRTVAPGSDPTMAPPVTQWEQVNFDNTQIAIHSRAAAKATVAARQTGFLDVPTFDALRKGEIKIIRAHRELTPYLKDLQTALANKVKVQPLISAIVEAANDLVDSGVVGIKDAQSQAAIKSEIVAVQSLISSVASILKSAGVIAFHYQIGPTIGCVECSTVIPPGCVVIGPAVAESGQVGTLISCPVELKGLVRL